MVQFFKSTRRRILGMRGFYSLSIGLMAFFAVTTTIPTTAVALSINEWLQAERNNPNLERALQAYEAARAGPAIERIPTPEFGGALPPHGYPADAALTLEAANGQVPAVNDRRIRAYADPASTRLSGLYIAGHVGNAFVMDSDYEGDAVILTPSMKPLGLYTSGALGLDMGNGFSIEAALSYQSATVDKVTITGTGAFSGISVSSEDVQGSVSAWSLMANASYAFGNPNRLSPYVMGGAGISRLAIDDLGDTGTTDPIEDSAFAFSYQAGAGVMVPLSSRTSVDLGYRYFGTLDADMSVDGDPFTADFSSHTVLVGLKHRL